MMAPGASRSSWGYELEKQVTWSAAVVASVHVSVQVAFRHHVLEPQLASYTAPTDTAADRQAGKSTWLLSWSLPEATKAITPAVRRLLRAVGPVGKRRVTGGRVWVSLRSSC